MIVQIEARSLIQSERVGIAQYVDLLIRHLLQESTQDKIIVWAPNLAFDPIPDIPGKIFKGMPFFRIPRVLLEHIWHIFPVQCVSPEADVYHLPYPAIPARLSSKQTKLVCTIHDLTYLHYPSVISNASYLKYLKKAFPLQIKHSHALIADSIATKNDIIEFFGVEESKIHVVYLGTDLKAPDEEGWETYASAEFERLGVPQRYILSVGTLEPRKNLTLLFRAAHQLRDELRQSDMKICLVGAAGWKNEAMEALIHELKLDEFIVRLGYVPRELLPHLYARATAFVFPSLYEGFGLPVLEALACGAPSIVSNASSLPEVAGDAALLFDPQQPEELAAALKRLLDDETLRNDLRALGLAQARKFSWEKTARETLAVYRSVLK